MVELQDQKVLNTVIKNREKILILEKIVQELVNTGYVDQNDFRKFRNEAKEEIRKDFEMN